MFNDRTANTRLNRTFEKALRLECKGSESKLEKLEEKYVTIHQHNLQLLMGENFKAKNNLNPAFMKSISTEREVQCNLRSEIICNYRVSRQQNIELDIFST